MNTRKALKVMSGKGQVDGPLAKYAKKYMQAYDAKEAAIEARQTEPVIADPLIDVLRRKLADVYSRQDMSMPVVMRFDAYQVVRHAAETTKRQDRGLTQLARHLEKLWTEEPMGSLTVGQLHELRAHYSDSYPKSRCAKVIDNDIPKVGYSTLPVAKLARIASTIHDQTDFDNAIQLQGLVGDQMHQVRARTLIRELVALKDANVDARIAQKADDLSNFENITDTLTDEMDPPGEEITMDLVDPSEPIVDELGGMPGGMPDGTEGEMGGLVDGLEEVNQVGQEVLPSLPGAPEFADAEIAEGQTSPIENPLAWAFEEGKEKGPDGQDLHPEGEPPPSRGWQEKELIEHGKGELEEPMGDPLGEEEVFQLEEEPAGMPMMGARTAAPGKPPWPRATPVLDDVGELPGVGVDTHNVEELGFESQDLPPNMVTEQDDIADHVRRDHGSPYAPPDLTPGANPGQGMDTTRHITPPPGGRPGRGAAQSGEKAMSPPKPAKDGTVEVQTYMPTPAKDGGAELKKGSNIGFTAAEIEAALLDSGSVVKVGNVSISINDQNDEVELWIKDAGRACDLRYLDTAIADFIRYASAELNPNPTRAGGYRVTKLVPVPCGKCASVSRFPPTNDSNDIYECDCGHRTRAATVISLMKHGTIQTEYKLDIQLPVKHTASVKHAKAAMADAIRKLVNPIIPTARVESFDGIGATVHIAGASDKQIQKLVEKLRSSGMPRLSQIADPGAGAMGIPGGADIPIAPDPTQGVVSPGAPPTDTKATDVRPDQVPGVLSEDDIGAAFRHYKNMGKDGKPMLFLEAVGEFARDYKKQIENQWSPELDAVAIGIAEELFTSGNAPTDSANEPMADAPVTPSPEKIHEPMVDAPGGEQMPLAAARKIAFKILAQAKAQMDPKVNQTQGPYVKGVGKKPLGPGKDSEQGSDFKDPAVKKSNPAKQKSPTDMGKYQENDDPGRFKAPMSSQDSNKPKNKKLPNTDMGKDSDTFGKGIPVPKVTKNH